MEQEKNYLDINTGIKITASDLLLSLGYRLGQDEATEDVIKITPYPIKAGVVHELKIKFAVDKTQQQAMELIRLTVQEKE